MEVSTEVKALVHKASELYEQHFGELPTLAVFAPGRVNLIGEHVDYNGGFVLPFALSFVTVIVGSRTADGEISHVGTTFTDDLVSFTVDKTLSKGVPEWANYVKGTVAQYVDDLPPKFAFKACIASDVPPGSGLSSSAALEVAVATFVEAAVGNIPSVSGIQKALRCQKAEHTFAGTPCGIMDQYISAMGKAGNLLLIDCRSADYKLIPFGVGSESPVIILTNSQVKHQLSGSEYPDRVKSCREAVSVIQRKHKEVLALRDVTLEMLEEFKAVLDPVTYKRARHAVTEDARTLDTVEALKVGDFTRVGKNMTASHVSLRDDFEVSTEELDLLVELAIAVPGVYGSRMTGGGFGGCTVTLVHKNSVDALVHRLNTAFLEKTGMTCCVYPPMTPSAGAGTLPLQDILLEKKRIIEVVDGKTGAAPHSITDIAASWAMPVAAITLAVVVAINMLRKK